MTHHLLVAANHLHDLLVALNAHGAEDYHNRNVRLQRVVLPDKRAKKRKRARKKEGRQERKMEGRKVGRKEKKKADTQTENEREKNV
jgi:hypothetical protein